MGSVVGVLWLSCSVACGVFPDQGSNPCPLRWQADSYPLTTRGVLALCPSFLAETKPHGLAPPSPASSPAPGVAACLTPAPGVALSSAVCMSSPCMFAAELHRPGAALRGTLSPPPRLGSFSGQCSRLSGLPAGPALLAGLVRDRLSGPRAPGCLLLSPASFMVLCVCVNR